MSPGSAPGRAGPGEAGWWRERDSQLPHSHLQQVEQLLCPPALEGVDTRAHGLPPGLETEQSVLQRGARDDWCYYGVLHLYLEAISLEIFQRPPDWLLPLQVENEIRLCYLKMARGQLDTVLTEKCQSISDKEISPFRLTSLTLTTENMLGWTSLISSLLATHPMAPVYIT